MNSYNDTRKISCGRNCQQYTAHLFPTPIADNKDAPAPTLCIAFVTIIKSETIFRGKVETGRGIITHDTLPLARDLNSTFSVPTLQHDPIME